MDEDISTSLYSGNTSSSLLFLLFTVELTVTERLFIYFYFIYFNKNGVYKNI